MNSSSTPPLYALIKVGVFSKNVVPSTSTVTEDAGLESCAVYAVAPSLIPEIVTLSVSTIVPVAKPSLNSTLNVFVEPVAGKSPTVVVLSTDDACIVEPSLFKNVKKAEPLTFIAVAVKVTSPDGATLIPSPS